MSDLQSHAVGDLPRAQQLELLDGVLEQSNGLIEFAETGGSLEAIRLAPKAIALDLDAVAFDLVNLRTDAADREINSRLDRVAGFRARLEKLSTAGAKQ